MSDKDFPKEEYVLLLLLDSSLSESCKTLYQEVMLN
uniref:Uncharacterized protein n=1 Tax=Moniliophthora roreri TaxID=221103 RepID=A0A0W0G502_MONRR